MFSLRLVERTMPTGSKDPEVLLEWLLDSMGLVRRRPDQAGDGQTGALHRIMMHALLADPLKGWDSKDLGDETGLSNTGIHHQMVKLRECGLVSTQVEGKWHRHILRGGSMASATQLVQAQASAVLGLRMSELAAMVEKSDTRMQTEAVEDEIPFSITIAEAGPRKEGVDHASALVADLGLAGEGHRSGGSLASELMGELSSSHQPVTLLALSDRLSQSRGRVNTVVERMRSAGIVERVPMIDRIPQDVFAGLVRQYDARGEEWLMSRGGMGRLEDSISKALLAGVKKGSLDIGKVRESLSAVPLQDQRVLLNTLGGRMPYGIRMSGADGESVSKRVMGRADRALRRVATVAQRLDVALTR